MDSLSFSNTISKQTVLENTSMTYASLKDAKRRENDAISNERIQNGDLILDTYEVTSDAISGGMGSVWRVHHNSWNTDLAMKRPQPRFFAEGGDEKKAQFVAECENWINLGLHPNIVSCYYVREIGGVPTIFSEWMDGGSLSDRIKDGSLYEGTEDEIQERILDIAIQAARGLQYSHENGLIHQDFKPGNLLLTKEWDAKVADFGLAKAKSNLDEGSETAKTTGYTLAYCPQEQVDREKPQKWMDVFAWALTVFEMYAGKRLWKTGAEAKAQFDTYQPQCRCSVPEKMQILLRSCLTKKPDGFGTILDQLSAVYENTVRHAYARTAAKAEDTAQTLNNRALSFLDLGLEKEAAESWEKALELSPDNLTAIYNRSLWLWRNGEISYEELVRRCSITKDHTEFADEWRELVETEHDDVKHTLLYEGLDKYDPIFRFTRDGKRLYFSRDRIICYDAESLEVIYDTEQNDDGGGIEFGFFEITDDGKYLVSDNGCVLDAKTGTLVCELDRCKEVLLLLPDSCHCYASVKNPWSDGFENEIFLYDLSTGLRVEGSACIGFDSKATYSYPDYLLCDRSNTRLYAVGTPAYLIAVYDAASGEMLQKIAFDDAGDMASHFHHSDSIRGILLSADEKSLYYHTDDGLFVCPTSDINDVTRLGDGSILYLSNDGKTLVTRTEDSITFRNTADWSCETWNPGIKLRDIVFSSDETYMITVDHHCNLLLWDNKTRQCLRVYNGHQSTIERIAVDDAFTKMVTSDMYDNVFVWDIQPPVRRAPWHIQKISSYQEQVFRQKVIAQMKELIRTKIDQGEIAAAIKQLLQAEEQFNTQDFMQLRRELTRYCKRDGFLDVYEADGGRNTNFGKMVLPVMLGKGYATKSGGNVRICSDDGDLIAEYISHKAEHQLGFDWDVSRSGRLLAVGAGNMVDIWDVEQDKLIHTLKVKASQTGMLIFAPDEKTILTTENYEVYLWDIQSGKMLRDIKPHLKDFILYDVCFSSTGKYLMITTGYDYLAVMKLKSGWIKRKINTRTISSFLRVSPDGAHIFMRYHDRITVFDAQRLTKIKTYLACDAPDEPDLHGDDFCISPDGTLLAAKGREGVRVWSLTDETLIWQSDAIKTKVGHDYTIAFSLDSCVLYVAAENKVHSFVMRRNLAFPGWTDWDTAADGFLKQFVKTFPKPDEREIELFLTELQNRGFGYIRPEKAKEHLGSAL